MENLNIEATKFTPQISFDFENRLFYIKGKSYPEDTEVFYAPVFKWILSYINENSELRFVLNIDLIYFNSSSSKAFFNLFDMLEGLVLEGRKIAVNWVYEPDDEDNLQFGREFQEDLVHLEFNLVEKK